MPGHPLLFYTFEFDYDHDWRLKSTTLNINNEPEHNVLNYLEYHETGLPGIKHLHGDSQNSMYSWQHSYNPRGWLTALNSNTTAQLFNLELFYDELPAEADDYASEQYNGNISAMHWSTQGIDDKMGAYAFEYDNLNRLTDATYYYKDASNNLHYCLSGGSNPGLKRAIIGIGSVFDIGYDKNGNIDSLTRIGRQQSGWLTFDKLTYAYDANRLKAVDDEISGQNNLGDFHDNGYKYHQLGQAEYLYDHNGNMTSDINRSLTLEYALGTNLPERIIHPGGHIRNYYTPAGRKTGKKVFDASNNLLSQELYYGDLIIKDGRATRILHGDGVVNLSGGPPEFHYHLKDHLGNVRLVITPDASNNPVVLQANDYYPFGMSYSTAPGVNKFLYNGKEEQEMPGKWLDYGWRFYDAQLGRWHGVDPMANKYFHLSPYSYCSNNPIIYIDPDGREIKISRIQEQGKKDKLHISLTAKLYNASSSNISSADLNRYAGLIGDQIKNSFGGEYKNVTVEVFTDIQVIDDLSQTKGNDHLFMISGASDPSFQNNEGKPDAGASNIGGQVAKINADIVGDESQLQRTGAHEFGHMAGLAHPNDETNQSVRYAASNDKNNLMHQSKTSSGTNIVEEQIIKIENANK